MYYKQKEIDMAISRAHKKTLALSKITVKSRLVFSQFTACDLQKRCESELYTLHEKQDLVCM